MYASANYNQQWFFSLRITFLNLVSVAEATEIVILLAHIVEMASPKLNNLKTEQYGYTLLMQVC
jgi:hypothetical protein